LLDKLAKKESEVKTVEELFKKIWNKFRETTKEERKVEQSRTIEQEWRSWNEYVQEFKKVTRKSSYKERLFIEEFKKDLNEAIRKKLVKTKSLLITIRK